MNKVGHCIVFLLPVLGTSFVSCGTGSVAEAIRPETPTAASAMNEGKCTEVSKRALPLIVDWKSHDRGYLESTMKSGIAAVKYTCDSIELLPDCRIEGSYGFTSYTRKEEVVRLRNADEIRTSLPLSGLGLAGGEVGLELSRDSVVEIGVINVGMYQTTKSTVYREEASGPGCEGATHFAKAAFIGAFAMDVTTAGQERSAAELFGAGASHGSQSTKSERKQDGTPSACKVDLEGKDPPQQCRALIRLELRAIVEEPIPVAMAKAKEGDAADEADTYEDVCPAGQVWTEGKCTDATSAEVYQCTGADPNECSRQCQAGHAGSCVTLARKYASGEGVSRDPAMAFKLLDAACKAGDGNGCFYQAIAFSNGSGVVESKARARQLYESACDTGSAPACFNMGLYTERGWGGAQDLETARRFYDRGCEAGDQNACLNLGFMYSQAKGGNQDASRAASLYSRACEARNAAGCANLAKLYWEGRGVNKDIKRSVALLERACKAGHSVGCGRLATILIDGEGGVAKDLSRGVEMRMRACAPLEDGPSCVLLGLQYKNGTDGVAKNPVEAARHFELGCRHDQGAGCYYQGRALERGEGVAQDAEAARRAYARGCDLKSAECCKVLGR